MKFRDRTIATIDLGTNSILLLVVRRDDTGVVHVLHEGSEVVKLGEKLKETGNISQAALDRTISAIQKYQSDIQSFTIAGLFQLFVPGSKLSATLECLPRNEHCSCNDRNGHSSGLWRRRIGCWLFGHRNRSRLITGGIHHSAHLGQFA